MSGGKIHEIEGKILGVSGRVQAMVCAMLLREEMGGSEGALRRERVELGYLVPHLVAQGWSREDLRVVTL